MEVKRDDYLDEIKSIRQGIIWNIFASRFCLRRPSAGTSKGEST